MAEMRVLAWILPVGPEDTVQMWKLTKGMAVKTAAYPLLPKKKILGCVYYQVSTDSIPFSLFLSLTFAESCCLWPMSKQCHLWVSLGCHWMVFCFYLWISWNLLDCSVGCVKIQKERRNVGWATCTPFLLIAKKLIGLVGCLQLSNCHVPASHGIGEASLLRDLWKKEVIPPAFSCLQRSLEEWAAAHSSSCNRWRSRNGFPSEIV